MTRAETFAQLARMTDDKLVLSLADHLLSTADEGFELLVELHTDADLLAEDDDPGDPAFDDLMEVWGGQKDDGDPRLEVQYFTETWDHVPLVIVRLHDGSVELFDTASDSPIAVVDLADPVGFARFLEAVGSLKPEGSSPAAVRRRWAGGAVGGRWPEA